jgi:DnaJ-class molecular chaperone
MEIVKVEILQVIERNNYIIQCGYCKGRGLKTFRMDGYEIDSYYDEKKCPVCGGKGILKIYSDDILIVDSYCKGTGHQPFSDSNAYDEKICNNCEGSGVQSLSGKCKIVR